MWTTMPYGRSAVLTAYDDEGLLGRSLCTSFAGREMYVPSGLYQPKGAESGNLGPLILISS